MSFSSDIEREISRLDRLIKVYEAARVADPNSVATLDAYGELRVGLRYFNGRVDFIVDYYNRLGEYSPGLLAKIADARARATRDTEHGRLFQIYRNSAPEVVRPGELPAMPTIRIVNPRALGGPSFASEPGIIIPAAPPLPQVTHLQAVNDIARRAFTSVREDVTKYLQGGNVGGVDLMKKLHVTCERIWEAGINPTQKAMLRQATHAQILVLMYERSLELLRDELAARFPNPLILPQAAIDALGPPAPLNREDLLDKLCDLKNSSPQRTAFLAALPQQQRGNLDHLLRVHRTNFRNCEKLNKEAKDIDAKVDADTDPKTSPKVAKAASEYVHHRAGYNDAVAGHPNHLAQSAAIRAGLRAAGAIHAAAEDKGGANPQQRSGAMRAAGAQAGEDAKKGVESVVLPSPQVLAAMDTAKSAAEGLGAFIPNVPPAVPANRPLNQGEIAPIIEAVKKYFTDGGGVNPTLEQRIAAADGPRSAAHLPALTGPQLLEIAERARRRYGAANSIAAATAAAIRLGQAEHIPSIIAAIRQHTDDAVRNHGLAVPPLNLPGNIPAGARAIIEASAEAGRHGAIAHPTANSAVNAAGIQAAAFGLGQVDVAIVMATVKTHFETNQDDNALAQALNIAIPAGNNPPPEYNIIANIAIAAKNDANIGNALTIAAVRAQRGYQPPGAPLPPAIPGIAPPQIPNILTIIKTQMTAAGDKRANIINALITPVPPAAAAAAIPAADRALAEKITDEFLEAYQSANPGSVANVAAAGAVGAFAATVPFSQTDAELRIEEAKISAAVGASAAAAASAVMAGADSKGVKKVSDAVRHFYANGLEKHRLASLVAESKVKELGRAGGAFGAAGVNNDQVKAVTQAVNQFFFRNPPGNQADLQQVIMDALNNPLPGALPVVWAAILPGDAHVQTIAEAAMNTHSHVETFAGRAAVDEAVRRQVVVAGSPQALALSNAVRDHYRDPNNAGKPVPVDVITAALPGGTPQRDQIIATIAHEAYFGPNVFAANAAVAQAISMNVPQLNPPGPGGVNIHERIGKAIRDFYSDRNNIGKPMPENLMIEARNPNHPLPPPNQQNKIIIEMAYAAHIGPQTHAAAMAAYAKAKEHNLTILQTSQIIQSVNRFYIKGDLNSAQLNAAITAVFPAAPPAATVTEIIAAASEAHAKALEHAVKPTVDTLGLGAATAGILLAAKINHAAAMGPAFAYSRAQAAAAGVAVINSLNPNNDVSAVLRPQLANIVTGHFTSAPPGGIPALKAKVLDKLKTGTDAAPGRGPIPAFVTQAAREGFRVFTQRHPAPVVVDPAAEARFTQVVRDHYANPVGTLEQAIIAQIGTAAAVGVPPLATLPQADRANAAREIAAAIQQSFDNSHGQLADRIVQAAVDANPAAIRKEDVAEAARHAMVQEMGPAVAAANAPRLDGLFAAINAATDDSPIQVIIAIKNYVNTLGVLPAPDTEYLTIAAAAAVSTAAKSRGLDAERTAEVVNAAVTAVQLGNACPAYILRPEGATEVELGKKITEADKLAAEKIFQDKFLKALSEARKTTGAKYKGVGADSEKAADQMYFDIVTPEKIQVPYWDKKEGKWTTKSLEDHPDPEMQALSRELKALGAFSRDSLRSAIKQWNAAQGFFTGKPISEKDFEESVKKLSKQNTKLSIKTPGFSDQNYKDFLKVLIACHPKKQGIPEFRL